MNMILSSNQVQHITNRMPNFELSYETVPHKKVFTSYNTCMAIPVGKKHYAWFSFYKDKNVCYFMELNKEKKISKVTVVDVDFDMKLSYGTIFYGSIVPYNNADYDKEKSLLEDNFFFVIEDAFYYKGINMKSMCFSEKLGYIQTCLETNIKPFFSNKNKIIFTLPYIWGLQSSCEDDIIAEYETHKDKIHYQTHHLQIRKLNDISPYFNISLNNILAKISQRSKIPAQISTPIKHFDIPQYQIYYGKPQYKFPTVFQVTADIQYDIYHLFAFGKNKQSIYYSLACIPDLKTSIFMNSLFRNIKENKNIDYIELSDDEDDFENINEDKYVDLNKTMNIECVFHTKFKKWVPFRVVDDSIKVVHISKLVNNYF